MKSSKSDRRAVKELKAKFQQLMLLSGEICFLLGQMGESMPAVSEIRENVVFLKSAKQNKPNNK